MNNRMRILVHLLLLVFSLFLYFWADSSAARIQGPTRLVPGPDNTVVVIADDNIVTVSADGEVLSKFSLFEMGIQEPVADLFAEPSGEILIGLADSQQVQRYSPQGKFLDAHARPPSAAVPRDGRNFKFTKDPRSGMLYVADSGHHRLQIYGPDEQEIKVITAHGHPAAWNSARDEGEQDKEDHQPGQEIAFRFPNALAVQNNRMYATDTHNSQIVAFGLDGSFQESFPTARTWTGYRYPVRFSVVGERIYVINRGPGYIDGEVVSVPLDGSEVREFYHPGSSLDPLDILAREDDVLIADGNSKKILSYFPDGTYRNEFGKQSLVTLLEEKRDRQILFMIVRAYAIAGLLGVLASLLVQKRKDRKAREELGLPSEHQPVAAMQDILGPEGSRRRNILLVMLPGLGYAAAGRALRAIVILPILIFCVLLFLACLVFYLLNGTLYLWLAISSGVITAVVWTAVVLDVQRLNKEGTPQKLDAIQAFLSFVVPLVTAGSGLAAQMMREKFILREHPELAIAIQALFQKIMTALHFLDNPATVFAAIHPAALFLGWGGAGAGMFGSLAWRFRWGASRTVLAACLGSLVGMFSWFLTATYPGTMPGGAFYMPLSQGLLMSAGAYILFRKAAGSLFIIPAGIAGAWAGSMIHLYGRFSLPFLDPGESTRATIVMFQAYGIHLAILLALVFLEQRKETLVLPRAARVGVF